MNETHSILNAKWVKPGWRRTTRARAKLFEIHFVLFRRRPSAKDL